MGDYLICDRRNPCKILRLLAVVGINPSAAARVVFNYDDDAIINNTALHVFDLTPRTLSEFMKVSWIKSAFQSGLFKRN